MGDFLSEWLSGVAAAAIVTAVALLVLPDGGPKTVVRMVCACGMALAVLLPLRSCADIELTDVGDYRELLESEAESYSSDALAETKRLSEETLSKLAVEKAAALGIEITCEVEMAYDADKGLYAYSARAVGSEPMTVSEKSALTGWFRETLGIPPSRVKIT